MSPAPGVSATRRRRIGWVIAATAAALLAGLAWCEHAGWPFLASPAERWLGQRLQRDVSLRNGTADDFSLHLLGGIDLRLARLSVGQPAGFAGAPMVQATDVNLQLNWADLLRWRQGRPLPVRAVSAQTVDLQMQRNAAGVANWQWEPRAAADPAAEPGAPLTTLLRVSVVKGQARVDDALLQLKLDARFAWHEGSPPSPPTPTPKPGDAKPAVSASAGLTATASGTLAKLPLQANVRTGSALPWLADGDSTPAVPVHFRLKAGRAEVEFDGLVRDLLDQRGLLGAYHVRGPSLAAVGAPLRLTLPTTARFAMRGRLAQQGTRWLTVVDEATIGQSRLAGEFTFDTPPNAAPTLSGRLHGAALVLQDLGPAVGAAAPGDTDARTPPAGRVLPNRPFDIPSLRAMNANVLVDMARLDFGTSALQSAAPVHAHVVLQGGVLRIEDLQARLAQGQIGGRVQIDGRTAVAAWSADLQASGLRLEQAVRPVQRAGQAPYASGLLAARATLAGRGKSTADWLASADGRVLLRWTQGTVSHLAVEVAGLDIAQGLGLLVRGDDALKVDCGVADLRVQNGRVTPQVMVVDTRDSTLWVTGSLSLADEQLQLVARVQPKDFSPLTLRTPLHVDGPLAAPEVTLEKAPLLRRVVPAALLAMINPLAGLLPLLDAGRTEQPAAVAACQALMTRTKGSPAP